MEANVKVIKTQLNFPEMGMKEAVKKLSQKLQVKILMVAHNQYQIASSEGQVLVNKLVSRQAVIDLAKKVY